ncbi:MAG: 4-(cytidine 5'-diphospho)-2-C-methyl-D-erythritol kinase [Treponema sp.]|nr:4-(cytidine 5'-diphospho)-2-C-methyl-D-erythritol kinase [Treponema sp.]
MRRRITVLAPAKINLGLKVFPRRADGYHDIQSIFTTVRLCDEITVERGGAEIGCVVECEGMELPCENTFTVAYKAFCVLTGIKEGVRVHVRKRIPAGGGLGGGSSDASSFFHSLDSLFDTHLAPEHFMSLAGLVGSDVFFFTRAILLNKSADSYRPFAALVQGRGERVTPLRPRDDFSVVLVMPGVSVSTKEAYSFVDEHKSLSGKDEIEPAPLEDIYLDAVRNWSFKNDFTTPVVSRFSEIGDALRDIRQSGADFADMTGSGSAVYGVFSGRSRAEAACEALSENWRSMVV